ncbi:flavin reductase family protein [bacterium]|nr:flavin reductase family protein [candidate division CSSED10-310 bacterium]
MKQSLGAKTIFYPTPVMVIGTYDEEGRPNLATAAWGGICCSQPPSIAFSLRQATYTYHSVMARRAFTVNVTTRPLVEAADYAGLVSGRDANKFEVLGLTPVRSELVDAPYAEEFPLVLECKLTHTVAIGLHTQFIGEILDVKLDENMLDSRGKPDINALQPVFFAPGPQLYFAVGEMAGRAFKCGEKYIK